jgi:hypothetical protein
MALNLEVVASELQRAISQPPYSMPSVTEETLCRNNSVTTGILQKAFGFR